VVGGRWKVEGGRWKVEGGSGKWKVEWKVEGGRWKVEGGRWKVEVARGTWNVIIGGTKGRKGSLLKKDKELEDYERRRWKGGGRRMGDGERKE
jgi:hypothetical protein